MYEGLYPSHMCCDNRKRYYYYLVGLINQPRYRSVAEHAQSHADPRLDLPSITIQAVVSFMLDRKLEGAQELRPTFV